MNFVKNFVFGVGVKSNAVLENILESFDCNVFVIFFPNPGKVGFLRVGYWDRLELVFVEKLVTVGAFWDGNRVVIFVFVVIAGIMKFAPTVGIFDVVIGIWFYR